jgi:hypothetical protein
MCKPSVETELLALNTTVRVPPGQTPVTDGFPIGACSSIDPATTAAVQREPEQLPVSLAVAVTALVTTNSGAISIVARVASFCDAGAGLFVSVIV